MGDLASLLGGGGGRMRRAGSGRVRALVSVCLALHPFTFSSPSGVPGKKCGAIILSAEELSNCRVSGSGTAGRPGGWGGWGGGEAGLPAGPGPCGPGREQEDRAPQSSLSQNSLTRSWKANTFSCLAHEAVSNRALAPWLPQASSPPRHGTTRCPEPGLPWHQPCTSPAAGGPFHAWSLGAWHLLSFFTFSSTVG